MSYMSNLLDELYWHSFTNSKSPLLVLTILRTRFDFLKIYKISEICPKKIFPTLKKARNKSYIVVYSALDKYTVK